MTDLSSYLVYLEGSDLSEAQKIDLIRTVWSVMESFIDSAFGIHPEQQALIAGGISNGAQDELPFSPASIKQHYQQAACKRREDRPPQ